MPSVAESSTRALTPSGRISYARIDKKVDGISYEKFEIPNLIELQLELFAWFVEKGLRELFDEISPIKDFTGKVMELQFLDYEFGAPIHYPWHQSTKASKVGRLRKGVGENFGINYERHACISA